MAAIWFEVGKYKSKWLICQYYRQHKVIGSNGSETLTEQHIRFDKFLNTVSSVPHTNSLLIGHFNINLDDSVNSFNHRNMEFKDKLLNTLPLLGFVQMLRECTRFCSNSVPTLIDHIWITNVRKLVQTRIIDNESDHELITATVKTKCFVKNSTVDKF